MGTHHNQKMGSGQLFIVATPIGNLADISFRAVEILGRVDAIAAEDTRTSKRLLNHYSIATPMLSYHEHNEQTATGKVLARLQEGQNIALISDAGTPLISDPGYRLVSAVRAAGFTVVPIPGACSPVAALSASGLPTDRFAFLGFPPRSGKARRNFFTAMPLEMTIAIFESPRRLLATLNELRDLAPNRTLCVAREITKLHEEFVSGDADHLIAHFEAQEPRGEIVLLLGPCNTPVSAASDADIIKRLQQPDIAYLPPSARAKQIAKMLNTSRDRVYKLLMSISDEAK